MKKQNRGRHVTRRQVVQWVGATLVAGVACSGQDSDTMALDEGLSSDAGTLPDAQGAGDASVSDAGAGDASVSDASVSDASAISESWATGGTAAMVDKANYPNPFDVGAAACVLSCDTTIGPCHTVSAERVDVSDGWDGLPVRLEFLVLNEACEPVPDVVVEIWHTNHLGIYSGEINQMCNEAQSDREAAYFRGYQRTNAAGQVAFDTCYPGWYQGRVVHFHVRIQTGGYDSADNAAADVITQFFFTDQMNTDIFGSEPLYQDAGEPDTHLADDNVVGGEDDPGAYVLDVVRMSDGVMGASKRIILRSLSAQSCTLAGSGGPGGPGGPDGGLPP